MANENNVKLITKDTLWELVKETTYESTVKEKVFQINLTDFPVEALDAFLNKGVQRFINDSTTSDKLNTDELKQEHAAKIVENLKQGIVGVRRSGGSSYDELTTAIIAVVRGLFKKTKNKEKQAEYKKLNAKGKQAYLLDIYNKQDESKQATYRERAEANIKAAKAEAKRQQELAESEALDL